MNVLYISGLLLFLTLPGLGQNPASKALARDRQAILSTLKRQTQDWNTGRVDKFMNGYWPSDSLTFVGKAGITYGYKATLDNYKKRYPDRASMGTLRFDILQLDFPATNIAYVIGRYHLTRPTIGDAEGHFTLLWRKVNKRWIIISDHSS